MAARAIASLSLTFGLVSIPVKLYSATESSAAIRFKLMGQGGARLRQQYVEDRTSVDPAPELERTAPSRSHAAPRPEPGEGQAPASSRPLKLVDPDEFVPAQIEPAGPALVERADMIKGYEFERGKFVLFTADELKALQGRARQTIDIVSFIPERSVDPIYYDKAYYLAPDKRGGRTYSLLLAAMRHSGRCALAKWAWKSKEYVVQVRPGDRGLVLQQLLYADEVRSQDDLDIQWVDVGKAELELALQLVAQISEESYDPSQFVDEEKQRILAAVEEKIAGRRIVAPAAPETSPGQVVDLMAALRASLRATTPAAMPSQKGRPAQTTPEERKPAQRAMKSTSPSAGEPRARK